MNNSSGVYLLDEDGFLAFIEAMTEYCNMMMMLMVMIDGVE